MYIINDLFDIQVLQHRIPEFHYENLKINISIVVHSSIVYTILRFY